MDLELTPIEVRQAATKRANALFVETHPWPAESINGLFKRANQMTAPLLSKEDADRATRQLLNVAHTLTRRTGNHSRFKHEMAQLDSGTTQNLEIETYDDDQR